MRIVRTLSQLKKAVNALRRAGKSIGFVPTMGCLHEGHLTLIRRARRENDRVIVSIFVNPLQFNSAQDLRRYPRTEKEDALLCKQEKTNLLYIPQPEKFYEAPFLTQVSVRDITKDLCGATRPGHFEGVATVVLKLFHQVEADRAYFGEKDYQQLLVIRQMVRDLDLNIVIRPCPIIRDKDGLALSSRNRLLSVEARRRALALPRALSYAKVAAFTGEVNPKRLQQMVWRQIQKEADKVDYVEVRATDSLQPLKRVKGNVIIAAAAFFDNVRLIDNIVFKV